MADTVLITSNVTDGNTLNTSVNSGVTITTSVNESTTISANVTTGGKGQDGVGVPVGGTTGQVLSKINSTDYNTQWVNQTAGVTSVNGQTGVVTLTKSDVGLSNVDNTSDANKPISTATATSLSGKLHNLTTDASKTASFSALPNIKYVVSTTAGNATATVPSTGTIGDVIMLQKHDDTNTNILFMAGYINGSTTANIPIRTALQGKLLQWDGSYWQVISGDLNLAALDLRYNALITATTTADYYRGDKTFQPLNKAAVGLGNVDNTSDVNKPVSTATQTALNGKEPTITAGTTSQYYRGDKTFQTLDKTAVGLSNVDNTSDATKNSATAALTNKDLTGVGNTFPTLNQNTTGSAASLTTGRTIGTVTGDATSAGSSFNGTANNTNALTLATVNSNVGSFTKATVTVNAKGLVTAASSGTADFITSLTTTGTSGAATVSSGVLNIPNYAGGGGSAGITRSVTNNSSNVTLGSTSLVDYVSICTGSSTYTTTLPTAASNTNRYTIKNASTANQTIATTSSQTIDGTTTITVTPGNSVDLISDGSNWQVI